MFEDKLSDIWDDEVPANRVAKYEMVELESAYYEFCDLLEFARFVIPTKHNFSFSVDLAFEKRVNLTDICAVRGFYDHVSAVIADKVRYGTARMWPNGFHHWTIQLLYHDDILVDLFVYDKDVNVGWTPRIKFCDLPLSDPRAKSPRFIKLLNGGQDEVKNKREIYVPFFEFVMRRMKR